MLVTSWGRDVGILSNITLNRLVPQLVGESDSPSVQDDAAAPNKLGIPVYHQCDVTTGVVLSRRPGLVAGGPLVAS